MSQWHPSLVLLPWSPEPAQVAISPQMVPPAYLPLPSRCSSPGLELVDEPMHCPLPDCSALSTPDECGVPWAEEQSTAEGAGRSLGPISARATRVTLGKSLPFGPYFLPLCLCGEVGWEHLVAARIRGILLTSSKVCFFR